MGTKIDRIHEVHRALMEKTPSAYGKQASLYVHPSDFRDLTKEIYDLARANRGFEDRIGIQTLTLQTQIGEITIRPDPSIENGDFKIIVGKDEWTSYHVMQSFEWKPSSFASEFQKFVAGSDGPDVEVKEVSRRPVHPYADFDPLKRIIDGERFFAVEELTYFLDTHRSDLSSWEREFLSDVTSRLRITEAPLTEKQQIKVKQILHRYRRV